jgi:hypothetical protein
VPLVQDWTATKIEGVNVSCAEAEVVAGEWAGQQVGGPDAELPQGWKCDGESVCRKGSGRVTFALSYSG